jgi:hypothetical protein
MITFDTQEDFDAAVMAAVEKYLQVSVEVEYSAETKYNHANTSVEVKLRNDFSQTTFAEDCHGAHHF